MWRLALLGVVATAAALTVALDPLDRSPDGRPGPVPAATTGQATGTTVPSGAPPLCELLGDLGVGGTLGRSSADQGFAAAGEAAGGWLPDPAALARALGDHGFQSGCTRTWSRPAGPVAAALFQFPERADALAMRGQLRDALGGGGVQPVRLPAVTGGELYLLERGGGSGQLVMFVCNERVLQVHVDAPGPGPRPAAGAARPGSQPPPSRPHRLPALGSGPARSAGGEGALNLQRVADRENIGSCSTTAKATRGWTANTGCSSGSGKPEPYLSV